MKRDTVLVVVLPIIIVLVLYVLNWALVSKVTTSADPTSSVQASLHMGTSSVTSQTQNHVCFMGEIDNTYGVCSFVLGESVLQQPIDVFTMGTGTASILIVGGIHTGTEINTVHLVTSILENLSKQQALIPDDLIVYMIPALNIDGVSHETHNNAHGVDLNRNWPASNWKSDVYHPTYDLQAGVGGDEPLSEPEVFALYHFVNKFKPSLVITYHSQAGSVEDNDIGVSHETASLYAQETGYEHIDEWTHYEVTGDMLTSLGELTIPAFDVELGSRDVEFEKNYQAVLQVLEYVSREMQ
jgi:protein MpaA